MEPNTSTTTCSCGTDARWHETDRHVREFWRVGVVHSAYAGRWWTDHCIGYQGKYLTPDLLTIRFDLCFQYSDNILKGFATSLSIVLSSVASVALFNLQITPPFLAGSAVVLGATWMYNAPDEPKDHENESTRAIRTGGRENLLLLNRCSMENRKSADFEPYPLDGASESEDGCNISLVAPVESHEPLLGHPRGVGSSSAGSRHSQKPSMSGRLLEKVSGMVGGDAASTSGYDDEKGRGS
jgi:Nucleotide-sugar transporter